MHFDEGDVYEAMTEDGQRYSITVGARNEDGMVQVQSSLDAEPVNVNPEQVGGAILADMDRARASQGEAEQGEIDGHAEMPSADVDAAQSNVPVYQQSDVVEARMPGGTVRGEIFEVSDEDGAPVYSVQWESPVQGVMVGRYSGEELSALQPAAERENVAAELRSSEEAEAHATSETLTDEEIEVLLANMKAAATPSVGCTGQPASPCVKAMIKETTDGLALKEREAAINNVDATVAASPSEWRGVVERIPQGLFGLH